MIAAAMNDQISALLAETHNSLREQLHAAERQFDRLQQLLETRESKDIANLNHAARRLRSSGSQWGHVLVESSAAFCEHAALFTLPGGSSLHLKNRRAERSWKMFRWMRRPPSEPLWKPRTRWSPYEPAVRCRRPSRPVSARPRTASSTYSRSRPTGK